MGDWIWLLLFLAAPCVAVWGIHRWRVWTLVEQPRRRELERLLELDLRRREAEWRSRHGHDG